MGWLFTRGSTRADQIVKLTKDRERTTAVGITVKDVCLAHCYRGGSLSGVLWTVWERAFESRDDVDRPAERWITCDLLQYKAGFGWGYGEADERSFPLYFSCPLKYLEMVPIDQYGGNAAWRQEVRNYHALGAEERLSRRKAA
jgi:hypothetical protein